VHHRLLQLRELDRHRRLQQGGQQKRRREHLARVEPLEDAFEGVRAHEPIEVDDRRAMRWRRRRPRRPQTLRDGRRVDWHGAQQLREMRRARGKHQTMRGKGLPLDEHIDISE
jgi:hypothetical protein